ncbi:ferredoxin [Nocardioides fonticola]
MRLTFDASRCCSSGMCESFAPDVFEIGDDGALEIHDPNPPDSERARIQVAVAACPTGALAIEE